MHSNENDAMERNDVLSQANIFICYMPKTELCMRRYGTANIGKKLGLGTESQPETNPDLDLLFTHGTRIAGDGVEVAGEGGFAGSGRNLARRTPAREEGGGDGGVGGEKCGGAARGRAGGDGAWLQPARDAAAAGNVAVELGGAGSRRWRRGRRGRRGTSTRNGGVEGRRWAPGPAAVKWARPPRGAPRLGRRRCPMRPGRVRRAGWTGTRVRVGVDLRFSGRGYI